MERRTTFTDTNRVPEMDSGILTHTWCRAEAKLDSMIILARVPRGFR